MTVMTLNGKGSPSEYVELYRRLGLNVIKAERATKRPTGEWARRRGRPPTDRQWDALSRHAERGNPIFLITGAPSQLVTLDLDTPEAVALWRGRLGHAWDEIPRVRTPSGGNHLYFALRPGQAIRSVNRHAEGWELKADGTGAVLPTGQKDRVWEVPLIDPLPAFDDYLAEHIEAAQASHADGDEPVWKSTEWSVPYGEHDNTLTSLAGHFRHYLSADEGEIADLLTALAGRFEDAGDDLVTEMIPRIARSIGQKDPGEIAFTDRLMVTRRTATPVLDDLALQGPIGDYVRFLAPRTEAHPAAMLVQALAVFGNRIGAQEAGDKAPGFKVGASYHRPALYVMVIGDSGDGAKGDSWEYVNEFLREVDPTFEAREGVQTGEGFIAALADDTPEEEHSKINGEQVQHVRKGGQEDRRFFNYEPEYGRVLHVAARPGSTIKDVVRALWDHGSTGKLTAGSDQVVSEVTLSMVGHVTPAELERDFDTVDFMSGYGNRFLFCWSKRTKHLPTEDPVPRKKRRRFAEPLRDALDFAHYDAPQHYDFSADAETLWDDLALRWKKDRHPSAMVNALTARARPQVRRLAVIYAVADLCGRIEFEHLQAAAAVWDYSVQTVEYCLSSQVGDKDADRLLRLLREHPAGISDNEIKVALGGHWSSDRRGRALNVLQERGLVDCQKRSSRSDGRGRPKRVWTAR